MCDLTVVERAVDFEGEEARNSGAESTAVVLKRSSTGRKENTAYVAYVEEEEDVVEYGLKKIKNKRALFLSLTTAGFGLRQILSVLRSKNV